MVKEGTDVEQERRALHLFEEILDSGPVERRRRLEEAGAEDDALRRRVEELLAKEEAGELAGMEQWMGEARTIAAIGEARAAGNRVGAFEVVRLVGRGSSGWVYEARQTNPTRRVALKVLRSGLSSDAAVRRFRYESEILAYLQHPGIAQVLEAGVHREETSFGVREVPYFALEYVDGAETIRDFVREHGLSREEIVELFLDVCDAVHHGHQKGVIHRDLKAANLLVDSDGRPKVIDFGVARATVEDSTLSALETQDGQILGTMHTMSPEQFDARPHQLDIRTDVYSLGVVLYELLCDRLPYDLDDRPLAAAAVTIQNDAPIPPHRSDPGFPRDLEAVLLRALEKDRQRRYASADALADDLRRVLRREPVEARAPSAGYRARLFARRNPLVVTAAGIVFVVLVASTVVSTKFAIDANSATKAKDLQILQTGAARRAESVALEKATALKERLIAFNAAVVDGLAQGLANLGGPVAQRVDLVKLAVGHLDALRADAGDDVELLRSLADSYLKLGDALGNPREFNLGDVDGAEASYDSVLEIVAFLEASHPDDHRVNQLRGRVLLRRGDMARARSDFEGSELAYQQALSSLEPLIDDGLLGEDVLREMAATRLAMGTSRGASGDHEGALESFLGALELLERLGEIGIELRRSPVYGKIAVALQQVGDMERAVEFGTRAIDSAELELARATHDPALRSGLAQTLLQVADIERGRVRFEESEALFRRAQGVLEELLESDLDNAQHGRNLAVMHYLRANNLFEWAQSRVDQRDPDRIELRDAARSAYGAALDTIADMQRRGQALGILEGLAQDAEANLARLEGGP